MTPIWRRADSVRFEVVLQQLRIPYDGRQRVIKFMRYAAYQFAQRGQLFRL
jgi:hypothetical protein